MCEAESEKRCSNVPGDEVIRVQSKGRGSTSSSAFAHILLVLSNTQ